MSAGARLPVGVVAALMIGACDQKDPRPATWDYISPAILQPHCATASCHGRAAAVAGLDFSDPDSGYTSLTALWVWIVDPNGDPNLCRVVHGIKVCQVPHRPLVDAYDPAQSRLVHMLRAQGAPRMPPDRPLPEADIRLIEQWILDGAHKSRHGGDDAGTSFDVRVLDGPGTPADAGKNDGGGADAGGGAEHPADAGAGDGAKG